MNNLLAFMLIIANIAAWNTNVSGAGDPKNYDAAEAAKRHIARERDFLHRAVDELNRSQEHVLSTMRLMEKQIDAASNRNPSRTERDLHHLWEWYRAYEDLLRNNARDFEMDLSKAYSDNARGSIRQGPYDLLIDGCARMGSQLDELMSHFAHTINATEDRIIMLRQAVEYLSSAAFVEEKKRNKKQSRPESDRNDRDTKVGKQSQAERDRHDGDRYDRYKDITDAEIAAMQLERIYLEERVIYYTALREMGKMELFWINRKSADYEALGRLARAIESSSPVSIEDASNRMIKIYESDISYFKKKIDDISRDRARIVPSGTMRVLDIRGAMSENYDRMINRYDHHVTWLAEQAGAYRADIAGIQKEK